MRLKKGEFIGMGALSGEIGFNTLTRILGDRRKAMASQVKWKCQNCHSRRWKKASKSSKK